MLYSLIIVSILFFTNCSIKEKQITFIENNTNTLSKTLNDNKWTSYTNLEYGFTINYPRALGGNKLKVTSQKNKFFIEGLNGLNSEFKIPITVQVNVQNREDLEAFIKKQYGDSCRLGDINENPNEFGLHSINILNSPNHDCWVNWIVYLLYSPEKKKAVSMDLGQEPALFEYINDKLIDYSEETLESFRFIN